MRAIWNHTTIADSHDTVVVEGNHYFPLSSVKMQYLEPSDTHTSCHWKGIASYYSIRIGDAVNTDAVWYYPEPKKATENIRGRVAFWHGVEVVD